MNIRQWIPHGLAVALLLLLTVRSYSSDTPAAGDSGVGDVADSPAVAPDYVFTDIGALTDGTSNALGISSTGHVTGSANFNGVSHAMTYFSGVITDLGALGNNSLGSTGNGINAAGTVVGASDYDVAGGSNFTAVVNNGKGYVNIGVDAVVQASSGNLYPGSECMAINESGAVVGYAQILELKTSTKLDTLPFVNVGGKSTYLANMLGQTSEALAINNLGQIVGYSTTDYKHAFLYSKGAVTQLGGLPGSNFSVASGINDSGEITGESGSSNTTARDVFSYKNGVMTDLGTLGGQVAEASGINNNGDIVGNSNLFFTDSYSNLVPFLYTNGTMTPLSNYNISGLSGYTLQTANAINNAGQIIGQALAPGGQLHAYLLTPFSESIAPQISSPLTNTVKLKGQSITLTPAISGSNPLKIQWYKNGAAIAGATNATFSLGNMTTANTGNYAVVASNQVGAVGSNMTLTVVVPPAISKPPVSLAVAVGKAAKFTAVVTGTAPLTYQWQVSTDGGSSWTNVTNGNGTTGATTATLTIASAIQGLNSNQYRCSVNNAANLPAITTPVTLSVGSAPKITTPPSNLTLVQGQDASFTVSVSGFPEPTFQWLEGKTVLTGQTSATLNRTSVQAADANTYSVVVTNAFGSLTAKASLVVIVPAQITTQPASATVVAGKGAKFTVVASGSAKLTYQWQMSADGGNSWNAITKATASSYSIAKTTNGMSGQQFRCIVNNAAAAPATSNAATLTVN